MAVISITSKGNWSKTTDYLKKMSNLEIGNLLSTYGQQGVNALAAATPVDTGATANAWSYSVEKTGRGWSIYWVNEHTDSEGQPIAIMLQYGHGTGTGGYVQGRDYINPAIRPIFDQIANNVWKVVKG